MDNTVLTKCGKQITLNCRFGGMSWRQPAPSEKVMKNKIKQHFLKKEEFDNRTPSVACVDNAVVSQLPVDLILKSTYESFYILNKIYYSSRKIEIKEENLSLSIPNNCWEEVNVKQEIIESFLKLINENSNPVYLDRGFNKIENDNIDSFVACFYNEWVVFYRVKKNQLLTTVMRNTNTNCKNLLKATSNKKLVKTHRFGTVTKENSSVVVLGSLIARNNCFEIESLKRLAITPRQYREKK